MKYLFQWSTIKVFRIIFHKTVNIKLDKFFGKNFCLFIVAINLVQFWKLGESWDQVEIDRVQPLKFGL